MLFTVIFILLLIGAAVVGSIYSNFLVFYSNFEETQNYNKAYYEAIAALERAELVIRQREPGFVGSGGWKKFNGEVTENGNATTDNSVSSFSYISDNPSTNLFWTINSLTSRIPATGMGNVDWTMATGDSVNYNMMDYINSEIVMLYYDDSDGNPYKKSEITESKPEKITGKIRLPGKIYEEFGALDSGHSLPGNMELVKNDAVVDWQIQGNSVEGDFTIFAKQDMTSSTRGPADSTIRESDLNNENGNGVGLEFSNSRKIPIITKSDFNSGWVVVGQNANEISQKNFKNIFQGNYTGLQLKFSLLNVLRTATDEDGNYKTYPFLEYYLDFGAAKVPDKFYTINAEGKYGDFQINLLVKKPTIEQSVLGSFTVVF